MYLFLFAAVVFFHYMFEVINPALIHTVCVYVNIQYVYVIY